MKFLGSVLTLLVGVVVVWLWLNEVAGPEGQSDGVVITAGVVPSRPADSRETTADPSEVTADPPEATARPVQPEPITPPGRCWDDDGWELCDDDDRDDGPDDAPDGDGEAEDG